MRQVGVVLESPYLGMRSAMVVRQDRVDRVLELAKLLYDMGFSPLHLPFAVVALLGSNYLPPRNFKLNKVTEILSDYQVRPVSSLQGRKVLVYDLDNDTALETVSNYSSNFDKDLAFLQALSTRGYLKTEETVFKLSGIEGEVYIVPETIFEAECDVIAAYFFTASALPNVSVYTWLTAIGLASASRALGNRADLNPQAIADLLINLRSRTIFRFKVDPSPLPQRVVEFSLVRSGHSTVLSVSDVFSSSRYSYDPRDKLGRCTFKYPTLLSIASLETFSPKVWVGKTLYGYYVHSFVGEGGNGYVLAASREPKGEPKYALKVFKLFSSSGTTTLTRRNFIEFIREASVLTGIVHRNMVRVYALYLDSVAISEILAGNMETFVNTPPMLVFEYMAGGNLADAVTKYGPLSDTAVLSVAKYIGSAVQFLHSLNLVHLDIKPSNVFVSSPHSSKEGLEKLLLNGDAKLGDLGSVTREGGKFFALTLEYSSPDQVEAVLTGKGASKKMDVFSLGGTLYAIRKGTHFNPPQVVRLYGDALDNYVSGGVEWTESLKKAKEEYEAFWKGLPEDDELSKMIKEMTNPDPTSRPDAVRVVLEADELLSRK